MEAFLVVVVVVVFVVLAVLSHRAEVKRREQMARVAAELGLSFQPDRDYSTADQFEFLNRLDQGSNRYAFNVFSGTWQDERVRIFDYHYETHSHDSKGRRQTNHHFLAVFLLALPKPFPEVTITHEGFLSKVAQAFGYADIDFESAEFSRAFCVRSGDKKFAYDVCHPRMMELLLANRDLNVEIDRDVLAIFFAGRIDPGTVAFNLGRLREIRLHLPRYLFA
jgi:hypothetical protein